MIRSCFIALACAITPMAASAEGLLDKLKKGAENTGRAIENTANDVGDAVGNAATKTGDAVSGAATAVGDSLESTSEMLSNEDTPEQTRQRMDAFAGETLETLFSDNPASRSLYDQSFGNAVFDARQLTLVGATAGFGRGVAAEHSTGTRTYMQMGTGGVGLSLGIGGFERRIVILFEDETVFRDFITNGYDATAQAGTMFGEDGESEEVRFVEGRSIFVLTKKGWKVSASATGTKYWPDPKLN